METEVEKTRKEIIDGIINSLSKKRHAVMYNTSFCQKDCTDCVSKMGCHLLSIQIAAYSAFECLILKDDEGVKKHLAHILVFAEKL